MCTHLLPFIMSINSEGHDVKLHHKCVYMSRMNTIIYVFILYKKGNKLMKMAAFWYVVSFSLVDIHRHFRGAVCPHHQGGSKYL
jgi:hypothetical protein